MDEIQETMSCQGCGETIEQGSNSCEHCGLSFEETRTYGYSNAQSITRLTLFIILTGGLYQIYWFYRNWRDFKAHKGLDISVGLRTIGLFIPLVNLYMVGTQFKDLRDYEEEAGIKSFSLYSVIILWVVLAYLSARMAFYDNPIAGLLSLLLAFALIIPFAMVQKTLNEYWLQEQGDLPLKRVSGGEILVLIIGLIFLAIEILGLMVMFGMM